MANFPPALLTVVLPNEEAENREQLYKKFTASTLNFFFKPSEFRL
jgi:hypothetical protein